MKKSNLRKRIRESIRQLITEAPAPTPPPNPGEMLQSYASFAAGGLQSINTLKNTMPGIRSFIISIFLTQGPNGGYLFNHSNPNQPCNYLNSKITTLDDWITNNPNGNPNTIISKQFRLDLYTEILSWVQTHPTLTGSVAYPWSC